MKILIGTPVHESKDYCMEKWLNNVSQLEYTADLLMVDNSPGLDYMEKVKGYCKKYGIENYKIVHLDLPPEKEYHEKVARSREVIRYQLLAGGYDIWFSWECDQIIPNNSLDELLRIMEVGKFMIVSHNNWVRQFPTIANTDLGVALVRRDVLKKYSFILKFGSDPEMPHNWKFGDPWLKLQVLRDGGSFTDVIGVLNPVQHLDDGGPLPKPAFWDQDE